MEISKRLIFISIRKLWTKKRPFGKQIKVRAVNKKSVIIEFSQTFWSKPQKPLLKLTACNTKLYYYEILSFQYFLFHFKLPIFLSSSLSLHDLIWLVLSVYLIGGSIGDSRPMKSEWNDCLCSVVSTIVCTTDDVTFEKYFHISGASLTFVLARRSKLFRRFRLIYCGHFKLLNWAFSCLPLERVIEEGWGSTCLKLLMGVAAIRVFFGRNLYLSCIWRSWQG